MMETVEKWMGRFIKLAECKHIKNDKRLKEQFINSTNDNNKPSEMIKELTSVKTNNTEVTSKQVLMWPKNVEAQVSQAVIVESLKENTDFDAVNRNARRPKSEKYQTK